jgi:hypothetical protein
MTVTSVHQVKITPWGPKDPHGIEEKQLEQECARLARELQIGEKATRCFGGYSFGVKLGSSFVLAIQHGLACLFNMDLPKGRRIILVGWYEDCHIWVRGTSKYIVYSHQPSTLETNALIGFAQEMEEEIRSTTSLIEIRNSD